MKKLLYTIVTFLALSMSISVQAQSTSIVKGDVNNDNEVNIADINAVINVILGKNPSEETIKRADVNSDGETNIADVNAVIDIILGGTEEAGVANPQNVFINGLPKTIDGMTVTTNGVGQVVTIKDNNVTITFEYFNQLQSLNSPRRSTQTDDVVMTVKEAYYDDYKVYYITLNSDGFASHVVEEYFDGYNWEEGDEMIFEYDSDGYLTKMIQCYDYPDVTVINWQDGNIVSVCMTDGESDTENWENIIYYTSPGVAQPIANKGCVMFYDEMFRVDIDDLKYAYYAGLLGKSTKHLPMSATETYLVYGYTYTMQFEWTINDDGFPTSAHIMDEYDDEWFTFTW